MPPSFRPIRPLLCLLPCLLAAPARAENLPPILLPPPFPWVTEANRDLHALWVGRNLARAIAFGPGGAQGAAWGEEDAATAGRKALAACAGEAGGGGCLLYAVDLSIVAEGHAWSPANPPPAGIGIGGEGWEFAPDARYLWHGPAASRGAVVHADGATAGASPGRQPPAWVRHLNNAGFDVFRFDRAPVEGQAEEAWARQGAAGLRASGYGRLVFGGHGSGAWPALGLLDTPGLVDAVVAVAPAGMGGGGDGREGDARWLARLRALAARAASPAARLAFAQFAADPGAADPEARAAAMREAFTGRVGAVLVIDRPAGITGDDGGPGSGFGDRFGACLLGFLTEEVPRPRC